MKKIKIIYWVSTALVALLMSFSAFSYFGDNAMAQSFPHLGFPAYFRIELALAKMLGVIVLLVPAVPARMKEWAYAGFGIVFISAFIAHLSSGDEISVAIFPLIILSILSASYVCYHKLISTRQLVNQVSKK
jgi:hypothetical protein